MALTTEVAIRKMGEGHIPAVVVLCDAYFPDARLDRDEIRRRIANGMTYFVAEVGRELVGFVDVKLRERDAFMNGIAVAPKFEGRGIGTLLLQKAIGFARKNGKIAIELVVKESNARAVRFYTSNGFAIRRAKPGKTGGVLVLWKGIEN